MVPYLFQVGIFKKIGKKIIKIYLKKFIDSKKNIKKILKSSLALLETRAKTDQLNR